MDQLHKFLKFGLLVAATILIAAIFSIILSTTNNIVIATSGACSYHSGVDCFAGPDVDGSVICNDGWEDSSVLYRDMKKCEDGKDFITSLINEYCGQLDQEKKSEIFSDFIRALGEDPYYRMYENYLNLAKEYENKQDGSWDVNVHRALAYYEDAAAQLRLSNKYFEELKLQLVLVCIEASNMANGLYECGENSIYKDKDQCVCIEGYRWVSDEPGNFDCIKMNLFSDVNEWHQYREAIEYLFNTGVISGYADGTFKPEKTINRVELIKMIVAGKDIVPTVNIYSDCFMDIGNEWYTPYVCYAKSVGWIGGYPDGTFRPSQTLNRAEALKIILNAYNIAIIQYDDEYVYLDVDKDDWFAPYVFTAARLGIIDDSISIFSPEADVIRGLAAEYIYLTILQQ